MEGDVNWGVVTLFGLIMLILLGGTIYVIGIAINKSQPLIQEQQYYSTYQEKTVEGISYCQKKLFEFVTVRKSTQWEVLCQTKSPYKTYVQPLPE